MEKGVYTQRHPETTPLYKIVEDHYVDFKYNYDTKYSSKYGFFRPEISKEVEKYTECGIYNFGVARVVCQNKDCSETFFVPFSCRSAHFCPSCAMKNALDFEVLVMDEIIREVPMRHVIFTIPVVLRKNFFWHREHLNVLSRLAWRSLKTFMQTTLKSDGIPGAIQSIETHGNFLSLNPHVHILITDGLFCDNGDFLKMPKYSEVACKYLKTLWEKAVGDFCIAEGYVQKEFMKKILGWRYTGFSVYMETRIDYKKSDEESDKKLRQLIHYIAKSPIALEHLKYNGGTVLYKGKFNKGIKKMACRFICPPDKRAGCAHPAHASKHMNLTIFSRH